MNKKYDVGVVGCWYWGNYGSLLNGYATYSILSSFGLNVLNIVTPNNGFEPHAKKFFDIAYPPSSISDVLNFDRIKEYNKMCDVFVTGSDQIWNNASTLPYNEFFRLGFTDDDKKRISFATSFGSSTSAPTEELKNIYSRLLQRYNAISVREDIGVDICREQYGVRATQIMEPVLDVDVQVWEKLAAYSEMKDEPENYLFAYILDPTPEKTKAIKYYAEKQNLKIVCAVDGFSSRYETNKAKLNLPNVLPNITCYDLLKYFKNSSFVISDSFHGTVFSMVFNKTFISITNKQRGISRFQTILGKTGLLNRLVDERAIPLDNKYVEGIDYTPVNRIISWERDRAVRWLRTQVFADRVQTAAIDNNVNERLDMTMCVGCGSCVSSCPTEAISLKVDDFGFYRASVNKDKCIDCGLCTKKCPAIELPYNLNAKTPISYAFVHKDVNILMNSASGGAFMALAKEAIRRGGAVVGAVWQNDLTVAHQIIENEENLQKFQKSKYLQSKLNDIYKKIKLKLDQNQFVLFSGCPCQVAGLKKYLGKHYPKLVTIDLLCAGCPSAHFFNKYIDSISKPYHVSAYEFRTKQKTDKIWDAYTFKVSYKHGVSKILRTSRENAFHQLFMVGSHCRKCKYQGTTRIGDLTIGDCWGIQNYDNSISPAYGVSAILVNNEKGFDYLNSIPESDVFVLKREQLDQIKKYNVCAFQENRNWPENKKRDIFFREINEYGFSRAFEDAIKADVK